MLIVLVFLCGQASTISCDASWNPFVTYFTIGSLLQSPWISWDSIAMLQSQRAALVSGASAVLLGTVSAVWGGPITANSLLLGAASRTNSGRTQAISGRAKVQRATFTPSSNIFTNQHATMPMGSMDGSGAWFDESLCEYDGYQTARQHESTPIIHINPKVQPRVSLRNIFHKLPQHPRWENPALCWGRM